MKRLENGRLIDCCNECDHAGVRKAHGGMDVCGKYGEDQIRRRPNITTDEILNMELLDISLNLHTRSINHRCPLPDAGQGGEDD